MQPVSGYSYLNLVGTVAGTTVVSDHNGVLQGVYFGTATTGTTSFYDVATAAGTATANKLFTVVNAVASSNNDIHAAVKKGIVAVVGGTVDMLITYL